MNDIDETLDEILSDLRDVLKRQLASWQAEAYYAGEAEGRGPSPAQKVRDATRAYNDGYSAGYDAGVEGAMSDADHNYELGRQAAYDEMNVYGETSRGGFVNLSGGVDCE